MKKLDCARVNVSSALNSRDEKDVVAVCLQGSVGGTVRFINAQYYKERDQKMAYRMLAEAQVSSLVRMMFKAEAEVTSARAASWDNFPNIVPCFRAVEE